MKKKPRKDLSSQVPMNAPPAGLSAMMMKLDSLPDVERERLLDELEEIMEEAAPTRDIIFQEELDSRGGTASIAREECVSGASDGVEIAWIDNGVMEIAVLPTRGLGIWKVNHRDFEGPLGWQSPVRQPVNPSLINLESRNGLGWLEGFNELVCRCGLSSNGPPGHDADARSPIESALTLHGRIANIPAGNLEPIIQYAEPPATLTGKRRRQLPALRTIGVTGTVRESVLFGPQLELRSAITTEVLSNVIVIEDQVVNTGSTATELQLLYHINIGTPFLEPGGTIAIPAAAVVPRDDRAAEGIDDWPTCLGPTAGYAEQAYFFEPLGNDRGETVALLRSPAGHRGVAVRFQVQQLPRFIAWKCTQPDADGYVCGLEPATNFPNFKAYERQQGRVISLGPGEKYDSRVTLTVLTSKQEVAAIEAEIRQIQGERPPVIHRAPQPGWSPAGEGI